DNWIVVSRIDARVLCACPKIAFGVEPEFLEVATSNPIRHSKVMVYSYRRRRQGIGMDSAIRGPGQEQMDLANRTGGIYEKESVGHFGCCKCVGFGVRVVDGLGGG